jgi:hypothetical protein
MPVLTQQFLQNLGINLDDQTSAAFSEHFEQTLGDRVVDAIVDNLDEQQVEQLAALRDQDDEQLQTWLQTNVPDLKEIVEDEVAILMGELVDNNDKI